MDGLKTTCLHSLKGVSKGERLKWVVGETGAREAWTNSKINLPELQKIHICEGEPATEIGPERVNRCITGRSVWKKVDWIELSTAWGGSRCAGQRAPEAQEGNQNRGKKIGKAQVDMHRLPQVVL